VTSFRLQTARRNLCSWFRFGLQNSPDRDSLEVLACHGNVIRYFPAGALGLTLRMSLGSGSHRSEELLFSTRWTGLLANSASLR